MALLVIQSRLKLAEPLMRLAGDLASTEQTVRQGRTTRETIPSPLARCAKFRPCDDEGQVFPDVEFRFGEGRLAGRSSRGVKNAYAHPFGWIATESRSVRMTTRRVDVGYQTLCPKLVTTPHEPSTLPRSEAHFLAPSQRLLCRATSGDAKSSGCIAVQRVLR